MLPYDIIESHFNFILYVGDDFSTFSGFNKKLSDGREEALTGIL